MKKSKALEAFLACADYTVEQYNYTDTTLLAIRMLETAEALGMLPPTTWGEVPVSQAEVDAHNEVCRLTLGTMYGTVNKWDSET